MQKLVFLIQNVGRALSREQILDSVWGYDYTGGDRTVDIHITRLREKLQGATCKIVTLRKFGYKLERRHE
ncbi:MAG: winged helix-turn-helix transcriptional regulator [Nostocales cyanobacterium W4_Combined_metabat2_030]|nr:winged helix-turn-helix transcriptional regulator [Nostocales cyanobacterium W4_Combined_metabat2_030]